MNKDLVAIRFDGGPMDGMELEGYRRFASAIPDVWVLSDFDRRRVLRYRRDARDPNLFHFIDFLGPLES